MSFNSIAQQKDPHYGGQTVLGGNVRMKRQHTREQLHLDISDALLQDEVASSYYADILPTIRLELPKDFVCIGRCIALNRDCALERNRPLARALEPPGR
jgi:hypothetical protein